MLKYHVIPVALILIFFQVDGNHGQSCDRCVIQDLGIYANCVRECVINRTAALPETTTTPTTTTTTPTTNTTTPTTTTTTKMTTHSDLPTPRDCAEILNRGINKSGVYTIRTADDSQITMETYCDMDTDGGGWLVFQRRQDGSVDFYRNWTEYQTGFGNVSGEFWLGNDNLASVTEQGSYELRVDLLDFDNVSKFAKYDAFSVDRNNKYRLSLGSYSGDAGDNLAIANGLPWTTWDSDNDNKADENCAQEFKGAWWYKSCHQSNLNGLYLRGDHSEYAVGVNWKDFRGYYYSLKHVEMKIRPAGYKAPSL